MTRPSPAPWTVNYRPERGATRVRVTSGKEIVCERVVEADEDLYRADANFRLMSYTPELLQTCLKLLDICRSNGPLETSMGEPSHQILVDACGLIEQATGRPFLDVCDEFDASHRSL